MKKSKFLVTVLCASLGLTSLSGCVNGDSSVTSSDSTTSSSTSSSFSSSSTSSYSPDSSGSWEETQIVSIEWDESSELKSDTTLYSDDTNTYTLKANAKVDLKEVEVTYTSSDSKVIEIVGDRVTVKGVGSATITAHAVGAETNEKDLVITINVVAQATLSVSASTDFILPNGTVTITPTVQNSREGLTLEASEPTLGTISQGEDGVFTYTHTGGEGVETITITLKDGEKVIDEKAVTITIASGATVVVNGGTALDVKTNATGTVNYEIHNLPEQATDVTTAVSSSDDGLTVAKDEENSFTYTANAAGSYTVTVKIDYKVGEETATASGTVTINVTDDVKVAFVDVDGAEVTDPVSIVYGTSYTFGVKATINGEETDAYTYSVEDKSVITVDATGKVTTLKSGSTKVTVTVTGYEVSSSIVFTVTDLSEIEVSTETIEMVNGDTASLTELVTLKTNGEAIADKAVVTITDTSIVNYNEETGVLTAVGAGETTIKVTHPKDETVYKEITVKVEGRVIITQAEDLSTSWTEGETLTDTELLEKFTVSKEGDAEYQGRLTLSLQDSSQQEAWTARTAGTYTLIVKDEVSGVSISVTIQIVKKVETISFYYYETDPANYEDLTTIWMWGQDNVNRLITGLAESQEAPESYTFREVVRLNAEGNEVQEGGYEVLKFTIDTSLEYQVYSDWNATTAASSKLEMKDLNSGLILRKDDGSLQTSDLNFNINLTDTSSPAAYFYGNRTIYNNPNALGAKYKTSYTFKDLYDTYIDESSKVAETEVKKVNIYYHWETENYNGTDTDRTGWMTSAWIFGVSGSDHGVNQTLIETYIDDVRYTGYSFDLTKEMMTSTTWPNSSDPSYYQTAYKFTVDDLTKMLFLDVGNDTRTKDITFDKDTMLRCVDENGVMNIFVTVKAGSGKGESDGAKRNVLVDYSIEAVTETVENLK